VADDNASVLQRCACCCCCAVLAFLFLCNKRGLMDQRAHQSNLLCTLVLPPVMLIIFLMAAVIGFFFLGIQRFLLHGGFA